MLYFMLFLSLCRYMYVDLCPFHVSAYGDLPGNSVYQIWQAPQGSFVLFGEYSSLKIQQTLTIYNANSCGVLVAERSGALESSSGD